MKPRLIRYQGSIWEWWGIKDHNGRLELHHLTRDGEGIMAKPEQTHELTGQEYEIQMEAIKCYVKS